MSNVNLTKDKVVQVEQQSTFEEEVKEQEQKLNIDGIQQNENVNDTVQINTEEVKIAENINKRAVPAENLNLNDLKTENIVTETTEEKEKFAGTKEAHDVSEKAQSSARILKECKTREENITKEELEKKLQLDARWFSEQRRKQHEAANEDAGDGSFGIVAPKYNELRKLYTRLLSDTDASSNLFESVRISFETFFKLVSKNITEGKEYDSALLDMQKSVDDYYSTNSGVKFSKKGRRRRQLTKEMQEAILKLTGESGSQSPEDDDPATTNIKAVAFEQKTHDPESPFSVPELAEIEGHLTSIKLGQKDAEDNLHKTYDKIFDELAKSAFHKLSFNSVVASLDTPDVYRFIKLSRKLEELGIFNETSDVRQEFDKRIKEMDVKYAGDSKKNIEMRNNYAFIMEKVQLVCSKYGELEKKFARHGLSLESGSILSKDSELYKENEDSIEKIKEKDLVINQAFIELNNKQVASNAKLVEAPKIKAIMNDTTKIEPVQNAYTKMARDKAEADWFNEVITKEKIAKILFEMGKKNEKVLPEAVAFILVREAYRNAQSRSFSPEEEEILEERGIKSDERERVIYSMSKPVRMLGGKYLSKEDEEADKWNQRYRNTFLYTKETKDKALQERKECYREIINEVNSYKNNVNLLSIDYVMSHPYEAISLCRRALCDDNIQDHKDNKEILSELNVIKKTVVKDEKDPEKVTVTYEKGSIFKNKFATEYAQYFYGAFGPLFTDTSLENGTGVADYSNMDVWMNQIQGVLLSDRKTNMLSALTEEERKTYTDQILRKNYDYYLKIERRRNDIIDGFPEDKQQQILLTKMMKSVSSEEWEQINEKNVEQLNDTPGDIIMANCIAANAVSIKNTTREWDTMEYRKSTGMPDATINRLTFGALYNVKKVPEYIEKPKDEKDIAGKTDDVTLYKMNWNRKYLNSYVEDDTPMEEKLKARYECLNDIVDRFVNAPNLDKFLEFDYAMVHIEKFLELINLNTVLSDLGKFKDHEKFFNDLSEEKKKEILARGEKINNMVLHHKELALKKYGVNILTGQQRDRSEADDNVIEAGAQMLNMYK